MMPIFHPFKGAAYDEATRRTLILGESHYDVPEDDPAGFTQAVVEDWRSGVAPTHFLDNVAALLRADDAVPIRRELDAAAFYNFVQEGMATASERPTRAQLTAAAPYFPYVFDTLAPTHLLVAGRTQWPYLPRFDIDLGKRVLGGQSVELGIYRTRRGPALATSIPHPSWRYFTVAAWRDAVQEFLALDPAVCAIR